MSADRIRHIQETVARAQELKLQEERQRLAAIERAKQEKEAAEKARIEAIQAANEARLRATGVVELFEQLRDNGVVKLKEAYYREEEKRNWLGISHKEKVLVENCCPAVVSFEGIEHFSISLYFDATYGYDSHGDTTFRCAYARSVRAQLLPDNKLEINGEIVGSNLDEVVTRAIINQKNAEGKLAPDSFLSCFKFTL